MTRMRFLSPMLMSLLLLWSEASAAPKGSTLVVQGSGAAKVVSKEEASKNMAKALWGRVLGSRQLSAGKRRALAEQVHKALTEGRFAKQDEGLLYLSLAVLHSFDKGVRFSALPFVMQAKLKWKDLNEAKDLPSLWGFFVKNFDGGSVAEDATLAGIADAFDGPLLAAADPLRFSYFRGLSRFGAGKWTDALASFVRVPLDSHDYRNAKFLEGMSQVQLGRLDEAKDALQMVVALEETEAERSSSVSSSETVKLREKGVLNVARILYEQKHFGESLAYYRSLMQDSHYFYDSLAEQGWAFFMAGFPNRAMGAVYAASSPFFADKFNPDILFLDAAVSYWLCDFDAAREKVQKFIEHSRQEGDISRNTFARTLAQPDALIRFSRLVEDTKRGVSAKNMGLGRKVQVSLLEAEGVSESLVALEKLTLTRAAFSRSASYSQGKIRIETALGEFERMLRQTLGAQVRAKFGQMSGDFEKTLTQSRILYLELLTAKKDAIVGKGRTVGGGEFVGDEKQFMDLGEKVAKSWSQDKNEYWFDELGHYVFQEKSRCAGNIDKDRQK